MRLPTEPQLDRLCGAQNWRVFGVAALVYDADWVYFEIAKPRFWQSTPHGRIVVTLGSIGGHLEPGEDLLTCLQREAVEELNVAVQVQGCADTCLIFEHQLQPNTYSDGDRPLPWFISVRRNQLPAADDDVDYLAIVAYVAQALGRPAAKDLYGLLAIPRGRWQSALSQQPVPLDELIHNTGAQLQLNGPLPPEAWVQPILTAESIRKMLAHSGNPTCLG
jgi:8-oxo-dGTP pyrophosphatase MutT (NUDIX family)